MENKAFLKTTTGKIVLGVIILVLVVGVGLTAITVTGRVSAKKDYVGEEKAKSIALGHAGVKEADVARMKVDLDYDDGMADYEVEFYYNQQEYDYSIDAKSGVIITYDGPVNTTANTPAADNKETYIGEEKAKEIAAAKVTGMNAADVMVRMDNEDGRNVYEGQFIFNNLEYDFTIDAVTGAVLEWTEDND